VNAMGPRSSFRGYEREGKAGQVTLVAAPFEKYFQDHAKGGDCCGNRNIQ
jgi:hypothetical protein